MTFEYDGIRYIGSFAPLFVHQYSQAWFDFRGKRDQYADYFQNSIIATDVHRRFCMDLASQFPDYSEDLGASPLRIRRGDTWYGEGRRRPGRSTARVVPCAAGGSLPFLPQPAVRVLRNDQESLRTARVDPLRIRGCVQSTDELVRQRRGRNRHGNYAWSWPRMRARDSCGTRS